MVALLHDGGRQGLRTLMRLHSALCRTSALVVGALLVLPGLLTGCKGSSGSQPAETGGGPAAQTSDAQGGGEQPGLAGARWEGGDGGV